MKKNEIKWTNRICISGKITSEIIYSHAVYGKSYYCAFLESERVSGFVDVLRLIISEQLGALPIKGQTIEVIGQIRSYNEYNPDLNRYCLKLFIFVQEMNVIEKNIMHRNELCMMGTICREPTYRATPYNKKISDVLLAVNRKNNHKSDYIPCIFWGKRAKQISKQEVGSSIAIGGRFQSRCYQKEPSGQIYTTYEVSAFKVFLMS